MIESYLVSVCLRTVIRRESLRVALPSSTCNQGVESITLSLPANGDYFIFPKVRQVRGEREIEEKQRERKK